MFKLLALFKNIVDLKILSLENLPLFLVNKSLGFYILFLLFDICLLPALASNVNIYGYETQGSRVTLKVRISNDEGVPVSGLDKKNFAIETEDGELDNTQFELIPPEESKPDNTYLIVLLDMSGSMMTDNRLTDAVEGIREFIKEARSLNLPVKISIIPYGEGGDGYCKNTYEVDRRTIKKEFKRITSQEIDRKLNNLKEVKACAATNIYQPISEAFQYFGSEFLDNKTFNQKQITNLAVIVFSDGYDSVNQKEAKGETESGYRRIEKDESERFDTLAQLMRKYPQVIVHTIGYGEKLSQLVDRAYCINEPQKDQDSIYLVSSILENCSLRERSSDNEIISLYIVDESRLSQIARKGRPTNQNAGDIGISRFPESSKELVESLTEFLTTLRKYEIVYQQPGAGRSTKHKVSLIVNSPNENLNNLESTKQIRMDNWGYNPLPLTERLIILGLTLLIGIISVYSFILWSQKIKEKSDRNLY